MKNKKLILVGLLSVFVLCTSGCGVVSHLVVFGTEPVDRGGSMFAPSIDVSGLVHLPGWIGDILLLKPDISFLVLIADMFTCTVLSERR